MAKRKQVVIGVKFDSEDWEGVRRSAVSERISTGPFIRREAIMGARRSGFLAGRVTGQRFEFEVGGGAAKMRAFGRAAAGVDAPPQRLKRGAGSA